MTATLRTFLAHLAKRLDAAAVDSPRLSAEVLLAHGLEISRSDLTKKLIMEPDATISASLVPKVCERITRRESGEPVAYIVGVKEFFGRDFSVTSATLVPRPETEVLVEAALAFAAARHASIPSSFIDLGTGSGAIAITLALECPDWSGTAVDLSVEAVSVAQQNARTLGANNLDIRFCDFLGPDLPQGPYGMVLSNPPYVSEMEYKTISNEVRAFEPKSALVPNVPNANGLEYLLDILDLAENMLVPGGLLLMEMGCMQGKALLERAACLPGWRDCRVIHDLAGLPRVLHSIRV